MKINITNPIVGYDGKQMIDGGGNILLTLQEVLKIVVSVSIDDDKTTTVAQKVINDGIAIKIFSAFTEVDLTSEEITYLKDRVNKIWSSNRIVTEVNNLLEGNEPIIKIKVEELNKEKDKK